MKKFYLVVYFILIVTMPLSLIGCNNAKDMSPDDVSVLLLDACTKTYESTDVKASLIYEYDDSQYQHWECDSKVTITGNLSNTKLKVENTLNWYDDPSDKTKYKSSYENKFWGKGEDYKYYALYKNSNSIYKDGSEIISSRQYTTNYEILNENSFFKALSIQKNTCKCTEIFDDIYSYINSPKTQITCKKAIMGSGYSVNMVCYKEWQNTTYSIKTQYLIKYNISVTISDGLITNMEATGERYINDIFDENYQEFSQAKFEYKVPNLVMPNLSEYI